jgi:ABC-type sugar transport system ATPase subunit
MASIRLENVSKNYGPVEAVKNLDLFCEDGALLALLGPSGCGKTTTLKMIAGIEEPSRGEICFDDRPVSRLQPGERNIAMVFEDYALYPHLSVLENIAFPLRLRRLPAAEIERKVDAALRLLDMVSIRDYDVKSLSGGAQQRVAIGRAFVRDPELVLFDEPLSHLDGDQKVRLRGEIKRLQKEKGLTSILVTHDQTEAMAMADRVAVMNLGVLNQLGDPKELYEHPANLFVANFISEPPMNLFSGELSEEGGAFFLKGNGWVFPFGSDLAQRIRKAATDSNVVAGIRPEHIRLLPEPAGQEEVGGLSGTVFFRELRGDEGVFLVRLSGAVEKTGAEGILVKDMVTVEIHDQGTLREDEPVRMFFPEDRVHLFDGRTGKNLFMNGKGS